MPICRQFDGEVDEQALRVLPRSARAWTRVPRPRSSHVRVEASALTRRAMKLFRRLPPGSCARSRRPQRSSIRRGARAGRKPTVRSPARDVELAGRSAEASPLTKKLEQPSLLAREQRDPLVGLARRTISTPPNRERSSQNRSWRSLCSIETSSPAPRAAANRAEVASSSVTTRPVQTT